MSLRQLVELMLFAQTGFAALLLFGSLLGARHCRRHHRRVSAQARLPLEPRDAREARLKASSEARGRAPASS